MTANLCETSRIDFTAASTPIEADISKDLRETLRQQGVDLVYKVRKNMKPLPLSVSDEVLLKKRMLIESVIRVLKTQTQLEHTRHRKSRQL